MTSIAEQAKLLLQTPPEPTAAATSNPTTSPPIENPALTPAGGDVQDEFERILDELADGVPEPTLLRLGEEDVALDMDEVVVDVIDDEEEESSGDDDSEESNE